MQKTFQLQILVMAAVALAQASLADDVIRLSEPVESTETHEIFGSSFTEAGSEAGTAMNLKTLVAKSDQYLGKSVTVETRVAKVCQRKGCFFIAQEGSTTARVTFKDYGFFIPTDSANKNVTVQGVFSRQSLSEKDAAHYAEDLGERLGESEAGNAPTFEYHILASSISVPRH